MEDKTLQRLAERSTDKNIFVFTDFLEEAEQKIAIRMQKFVTFLHYFIDFYQVFGCIYFTVFNTL